MSNIKEWLIEAEKFYGETIEAIVVGPHDKRPGRWGADDKALSDENVILSRDDGLRKLDQEYDSGYGGADCFPMYTWTKSRVFFIGEYDGSTGITWAPRNPVALEPQFSGQSIAIDMIRAPAA